MSYFFHPNAQTEYLEAIAFYETKSAGLGASYIAEFEGAIGVVCEHPHRYLVDKLPDIR